MRATRQRLSFQAQEAQHRATLQGAIARAQTFSLLYVPFIHAVLRNGLYEAEIAAIRSLSPQHAYDWDQMVSIYRRQFDEAPNNLAAMLSAPNVQQVNMSFDVSPLTENPWPYIPAAVEHEAQLSQGPSGTSYYRWLPRGAANQRFTQEGVLSQGQEAFQRLQEMFSNWQREFEPYR